MTVTRDHAVEQSAQHCSGSSDIVIRAARTLLQAALRFLL